MSPEINLTEIIQGIFVIIVLISSGLDNYRKYFGRKKKKSDIRISNTIDLKVYEKLVECKMRYNADRCLFFQFHNGEIYFNNNSILKMSLTHESNKNGIEPLKNEFQSYLISICPNFIFKLIETNSFKVDTYHSDEDFLSNFKYYGIESVIVHRVEDKKKKTIGFVCLCYHRSIGGVDMETLEEFSNHIGFLI